MQKLGTCKSYRYTCSAIMVVLLQLTTWPGKLLNVTMFLCMACILQWLQLCIVHVFKLQMFLQQCEGMLISSHVIAYPSWKQLTLSRKKSFEKWCESWWLILSVCKCNAYKVRVMFSFKCRSAPARNSPHVHSTGCKY